MAMDHRFLRPMPDISYLWRDEFTTARATGSIDGTAAEPGPGTRNVTDLDSRITIAGGALTISAGGAVAWNRTGIWHTPAITRVAGQVLAQTVNWGVIGTSMLGFTSVNSANYVGYNNLGIDSESVPMLYARRTTGPSSPEIFVPAASTDYRFYTVLRASGRFIFIKSGGTTRLMWMDAWDATATLYAGLTVYSNTIALTMDSLVALENKRYSVLATSSDSFNRANGAPGSTDGAGHAEANSGGGLAWTSQQGTGAIAANKLTCSALDGGGVGVVTVDTGKTDEVAICETTRAGGNVGVVVRYVDSNNYIYAYHDGANAGLVKRVGGVETTVVGPAVMAYAAGALMQISCDGTGFWLYYDEDYVGNVVIADAALQTGTAHGVYTTNTGNSFDNWRTFARGNGGEYADLGVY
jgi:hypothetical protein